MTERRSKRGTAAVDEPVAAGDEPNTDAASDEVTKAAAMTDQPNAGSTSDEATDAPAMEATADVTAEADGEPTPEATAEPAVEAAAEPNVAVAEAAEAPARERAPAKARGRGEEPVGTPELARPSGPRGLQLRYRDEVVPALVKHFEYANPNMVPRLAKIVINIGLGEALTNAKAIDAASGDLTMITGQKPIVMKARRSIAQFKIRTGNPIGLKVTLRGPRMWDFLERLVLLALPRIRDFRGTPGRSFDGRGNYTLGLREQIAFPEIDYDKVDRLRGLEVSIVTTAKSDEESKRMLELLGMPFAS